MLHFEVIMYFHLYKYLWLRGKHNTAKIIGNLYRDIWRQIWCQIRRAHSSRNTIQVENVNCGMQFRQHQVYSVSSQGCYVTKGPQHVAKSPNKCSQQDYLISIILDCSCLISLRSSLRCHTSQAHNVTELTLSHHSGGCHGNRLEQLLLLPRVILLIEGWSGSARCRYHRAAGQSVFDSQQLAKTVADQRRCLEAGAAGLTSGSES